MWVDPECEEMDAELLHPPFTRNQVGARDLGGMWWFTVAEFAIEANSVIASRFAMMATGAITISEAQLMVSEKMLAAAEATAIIAAGGNLDRVVKSYRRRVKANVLRLKS